MSKGFTFSLLLLHIKKIYKNKGAKEEILNRIKTELVARNCPRETIGLLRNRHPQLIITKT